MVPIVRFLTIHNPILNIGGEASFTGLIKYKFMFVFYPCPLELSKVAPKTNPLSGLTLFFFVVVVVF